MVSCPVTVGSRLQDPVDVEAQQVEQFPSHHGNLTRVDPVGTEHGTPSTFRTLEEIVEPLFHHLFRKFPRSGKGPKYFPRGGEVFAVDRSQEFRPENRHVLGISGTNEEVAFVSTSPTPDADVQEKPIGPVLA